MAGTLVRAQRPSPDGVGRTLTLLEERIHLLAGQFAVALHAYAVMSNHLHLVIAIDPREPANWTDAEVVERWRRVFPVRAKSATPEDHTEPNALTPDQRVEPERIAAWRQRLGSLSWFMRALLEPRIRAPQALG